MLEKISASAFQMRRLPVKRHNVPNLHRISAVHDLSGLSGVLYICAHDRRSTRRQPALCRPALCGSGAHTCFQTHAAAQNSRSQVLANHPDTITARNEENVFEKFARKLAAVEICPNLRPNTGPSGGGDGKVDTETYEVSPEISDRWYIGQLEAASERWAFAISAKEQWKGKVRSDIKR